MGRGKGSLGCRHFDVCDLNKIRWMSTAMCVMLHLYIKAVMVAKRCTVPNNGSGFMCACKIFHCVGEARDSGGAVEVGVQFFSVIHQGIRASLPVGGSLRVTCMYLGLDGDSGLVFEQLYAYSHCYPGYRSICLYSH